MYVKIVEESAVNWCLCRVLWPSGKTSTGELHYRQVRDNFLDLYSMDQLKRGEYFNVHCWKNSNGSTITNIRLIQRTYFLLYSFLGQIAFEHVDAHMVDPGFGAPSYDDWSGNDVADKLAVEVTVIFVDNKCPRASHELEPPRQTEKRH